MTLLLQMTETLEQQVHQAAQRRQRSTEQFIIDLLMRIFEKNIPIFDEPDSIAEEEPLDVIDESIADVVARIKATPPNPAMITFPEASLAEALRDGPTDPDFDLATWEQEWAMAEEELKRINQLDDIAEGRLLFC